MPLIANIPLIPAIVRAKIWLMALARIAPANALQGVLATANVP